MDKSTWIKMEVIYTHTKCVRIVVSQIKQTEKHQQHDIYKSMHNLLFVQKATTSGSIRFK